MNNEKALEALKNVKDALARHLARQVGDTAFFSIAKAREALESDTDLQIIAAALLSPFDGAIKIVEDMIADQLHNHEFFIAQYHATVNEDKQLWLDRASISASKATHYRAVADALKARLPK